MVNRIVSTVALRLLFFVGPIQNVYAQPTLNTNAEEIVSQYGPKDRFDEGTMIQTLFVQIDLNHDQQLDEHEVHLFFQKKGIDVPESLWAKEDKNGDGVIDMHEFVTGNSDEL